MFRRSLERLFLRFRRNGDVGALSGVFDRTAAELLRVALHMAAGPAEAEDLVQKTFLSAIESAESFDADKRLVPWLLGILGNHAKKAARQGRRTVDPLRMLSSVAADPAGTSADREAAAAADRAIDSLPDPYRSVLVLHFRHGMAPAEIAGALGTSAATVRSHLHRGLGRLRRAVPAGFASALLPTLPAVRGLVAVREVVTAHAARVAAGSSTVVTASALAAIGGGAMAAKHGILAASALLLLLAGAGGLALSRGGSSKTVGAPPNPLSSESRETASLSARLLPAAAEKDVGAVSAGAPSASGSKDVGDVEIRVTRPDGSPAAGLAVQVISWNEPNAMFFPHRGVTGTDGRLRLAGLRAGHAAVYFSGGGGGRVVVSPGTTATADIRMEPGVRVEGTVVDAAGPVAGSEVWLSDVSSLAAHSDTAGRFTLRDVHPMSLVSARGPGRTLSQRTYVQGKAGETVAMQVRLLAGGAVRGHVRDDTGHAIAGARVQVGDDRPMMVGRGDGLQEVSPPAVFLETDDTGSFLAEGVPLGRQSVSARARGYAPASLEVAVQTGAEASADLALPRGATIAGVVRNDAGAPMPGAGVYFGEYGEFSSATAQADEKGEYALEWLAPGEIRVRAVADKLRAEASITVAAGETKRWDPVLGRGLVIRGSVRGEDGAPLEGYFVQAAESERSTGYRLQARTDSAGRFELTNAKELAHSVEVFAPDTSGTFASLWTLARRFDVKPGPGELALVVNEADRPSVRLRGTLVGPDGGPIVGATVSIMHDSGHGTAADIVGTEGKFESGLLPPGRVDLYVAAPGFGNVVFGDRRLARGKDLDVGRLVLETPGTLVMEVLGAGDVALERARCWVQGDVTTAAGTDEKGIARFERLQPGTYAVWTETRDAAAVDVVHVESGKAAAVRTTLGRAARREVVARLPAGDVLTRIVRLRLRREDDPAAERAWTLPRPSDLPFPLMITFPAGRYLLEAETDTGLVANARFDTVDPADRPIELLLR